MFNDVIVGDRLYSFEEGWGIVEAIHASRIYPLTMRFDCCIRRFTLTGRRYEGSENPALFWDKIEFEIPKRPLPNLKVDTSVFVWNGNKNRKVKRHFKAFNEDGSIICFSYGTTSWTTNGAFTWNHWELAEDNAEDIKKYEGE